MASVQYERNEEVLRNEEKANLDKLIYKHAETDGNIQEQSLAIAAQNEGVDVKRAWGFHHTVVAGALTNQTKGFLNGLHKKKFAGHVVKDFPNPLKSTGVFTLSAIQAKGVKAAVVYTGKNKAGVESGWLLAFADTKALKRRIYAEVGHKSKFNNIDWHKVEKELDKAKTTVNAYDPTTGTKLIGTIVGKGGGSAVGAYFSG